MHEDLQGPRREHRLVEVSTGAKTATQSASNAWPTAATTPSRPPAGFRRIAPICLHRWSWLAFRQVVDSTRLAVVAMAQFDPSMAHFNTGAAPFRMRPGLSTTTHGR